MKTHEKLHAAGGLLLVLTWSGAAKVDSYIALEMCPKWSVPYVWKTLKVLTVVLLTAFVDR